MDAVNLLAGLVENHQVWAYVIIVLGLILEGEVIAISSGILTYLGLLSFPIVLVLILIGGLMKTIFGYALGRYLYLKFNHNKFFVFIEKRVNGFVPRFRERPFWSIFISKFIIGANNLVIIFSGYEGINYRKFLRAEILATAIWAPTMLSLGYFFGYTALRISREIWQFSLIVMVLFILFVIFDKIIGMLYELFEEFKYGKKQ
ncbi:MAG: hypothetical protein WD991_00890 [Candidatus Paceibacterota bacterium]